MSPTDLDANDLEIRDRRVMLRILGAGAAGVLVLDLAALTGCAEPPPEGPAIVTVPLADLAEGKRVVVKLGKIPVELHREGDRIIARSLVCTHQGCTVAWQEPVRRYRCPCQDAWFDADGKPVQGPAERPLAELPATVSEGTVRVTAPG